MNYAQKNRNEAVKQLLKKKPVFFNSSSTDCDGCYTQSSTTVNSVQHLIDIEKSFESACEWADGPMHGYFVFTEEERHDYYSGGHWGNY